jgi:hypothetical protein
MVAPTVFSGACGRRRSAGRMFRTVAICLSFFLATSIVAAQQSAPLRGGQFAEGYSSLDATTPAELAHRMFTTSSRDCEELQTLPTRLESTPREIVVRVGEEFPIGRLVLQATDSSGRVIPRAPLALVVAYDSRLLAFKDDQNLYFSITGVRPGQAGNIIVQFLCVPEYSIKIPIRIAP